MPSAAWCLSSSTRRAAAAAVAGGETRTARARAAAVANADPAEPEPAPFAGLEPAIIVVSRDPLVSGALRAPAAGVAARRLALAMSANASSVGSFSARACATSLCSKTRWSSDSARARSASFTSSSFKRASSEEYARPAGTPSRDATGAALDALKAHSAATALASAPVSPFCCATRTVSFRALSASSARAALTCARASESAAAWRRHRERLWPAPAASPAASPAAVTAPEKNAGFSGGKNPPTARRDVSLSLSLSRWCVEPFKNDTEVPEVGST